MSSPRHSLTHVGLRVAVPAGATGPASATFAETVARSVHATVDQTYLALRPRLSVMTLTSHGWTAESAKTPVLAC
jgi:hypothetical protein